MICRVAASLALTAFAVCLLVGLGADNPFATILSNALLAMGVTFVVGLVVGAMAKKMLDENLAAAAAPNGGAGPAAPDPQGDAATDGR